MALAIKFDAVRLKGSGLRGVIHKRVLEAFSSSVRSYGAGEVLCNPWTSGDLELVPDGAITCASCARREAEISDARKDAQRGRADRPYMNASIDELEKMLSQHQTDHGVLGRLREELSYRTTRRAKQLMREVQGLIEGTLPIEATKVVAS